MVSWTTPVVATAVGAQWDARELQIGIFRLSYNIFTSFYLSISLSQLWQ